MAPPGTPNTSVTPRSSRERIRACAPVIGSPWGVIPAWPRPSSLGTELNACRGVGRLIFSSQPLDCATTCGRASRTWHLSGQRPCTAKAGPDKPGVPAARGAGPGCFSQSMHRLGRVPIRYRMTERPYFASLAWREARTSGSSRAFHPWAAAASWALRLLLASAVPITVSPSPRVSRAVKTCANSGPETAMA